ncbi:MAG: hypothetical protein U9O89_00390 [Thermoproteota archaeon]|nr:hypothetical protein [Thermoproteota archaeon]
MTHEEGKRFKGKCIDCGEVLELFELDFKQGRKILQCPKCGLYHFYKKDWLGRWKLVKAGKVSDLWRK